MGEFQIPCSGLLEVSPVTQLDSLILLSLEAELAQGLRHGGGGSGNEVKPLRSRPPKST